jgi:hypothetical protein
VPTWTNEDGSGIVDYALFIGTTPYGVVEAKKNVPQPLFHRCCHRISGRSTSW